MLFYDGGSRSYAFKLEISGDLKTWTQVGEFPAAQSWTTIRFEARKVKRIRVLAKSNTLDSSGLYIVKFMAFYQWRHHSNSNCIKARIEMCTCTKCHCHNTCENRDGIVNVHLLSTGL